jgi:hypothetical protein
MRDDMIKSLVRTFKGPSNDPRMSHISRPMPRDLPDEQVLAAIDIALAANPNPAYLVETLPAALKQVTGRDLQVLDRTSRDVTGAFTKATVMIRDGEVGHWPGYDQLAYPMLARDARTDATRDALAAAEGKEQPAPKAGWEPPPALPRRGR